MATGVWISLIGYFALMIAIGFYAMRKSTSTSEDYMLGGRQLSPQVAALSAGATGVTISGAGPSVVAACHEPDRRDVASAMVDAFEAEGVDARVYQTRIGRGARIVDS